MATITKTFTENGGSYNKGTWTISVTGTNKTVNGDFTLAPTVTAKVSVSSKGYGSANIHLQVSEDTGTYIFFRRPASYDDPYPAFSSGTTYSLTNKEEKAVQLSRVFNASNKTSRTANLTLQSTFINLNTYSSSSGASWTWYNNTNTVTWGTIATVTLDVPPTATLGTSTFPIPYAGVGVYTVPVTSAAAYYGGDVSKVTLTIGQDSTVQTYSSATITKQSISVTPTVAGTFTPTVTVEDSRGQTYTEVLSDIVVNPYFAPSLDFDVFRTNISGVRDDEGTYGLITANVSFTDTIADLTQPTVKINGMTTNSVTWYSTYNSGTGVSGTISDWTTVDNGDTIYGLINESFSTASSYVIGVTVTDSTGRSSSEITQTLSTAFYTIDFQAGGKEITFGTPANDNVSGYTYGLFKCRMDAQFEGDASVGNDLSVSNDISATNDISAGGDVSVTGNASITGNATINGNVILDGINTLADYVIENGSSGYWKYTKWNSGKLECWYEGNPGSYTIGTQRGNMYAGGWLTYTYPVSFVGTPTVTASAMLTTDSYVVFAQTSAPTYETVKLRIASSSNVASNANYTIHIYSVGKWK